MSAISVISLGFGFFCGVFPPVLLFLGFEDVGVIRALIPTLK